MKKASGLLICLVLLVFAVTAMAAEGGNPKKGKHLYKKDCKTCHSEGGEGGKLTPLSKTQAQWDRFFDKNKQKACLQKLSETDMKDVQQFLFEHAADSDQPETCG